MNNAHVAHLFIKTANSSTITKHSAQFKSDNFDYFKPAAIVVFFRIQQLLYNREAYGLYRNVLFIAFFELPALVRKPQFVKADTIDENGDGLIEVSMQPKIVKWETPITVGFFAYCYAKLRMLEFVYDFLFKYFQANAIQMVYTDTDSLYCSFATDSLYAAVKPELRQEFFQVHDDWMVAHACQEHKFEFSQDPERFIPPQLYCCKKYHNWAKRVIGVLKVEFQGHGYCVLSSKTYYCVGPHEKKYSSKRLQKSNAKTFKDFTGVLQNKSITGGVNRGFRLINGDMYTYRQQRNALSYAYFKRKVDQNGIDTEPLDV